MGQGIDGAFRPLQALNRDIGVDQHQQPVAQFAGSLQIVDMPGMQDVETAIGRHQRFTLGTRHPQQRQQIGQIDDAALPGALTLQGLYQLGPRNGRGAQFADREAGGLIGQMRRIGDRQLRRQSRRQCGNHRIAGPGHVIDLLGMGWQMQGRRRVPEQRHALFAPRDQQRLQFKLGQHGLTA